MDNFFEEFERALEEYRKNPFPPGWELTETKCECGTDSDRHSHWCPLDGGNK